MLAVLSYAFTDCIGILCQKDMFTIGGTPRIAPIRAPLNLIAGVSIVSLGNPEQVVYFSIGRFMAYISVAVNTLATFAGVFVSGF